jgi:hypothetical protein
MWTPVFKLRRDGLLKYRMKIQIVMLKPSSIAWTVAGRNGLEVDFTLHMWPLFKAA